MQISDVVITTVNVLARKPYFFLNPMSYFFHVVRLFIIIIYESSENLGQSTRRKAFAKRAESAGVQTICNFGTFTLANHKISSSSMLPLMMYDHVPVIYSHLFILRLFAALFAKILPVNNQYL